MLVCRSLPCSVASSVGRPSVTMMMRGLTRWQPAIFTSPPRNKMWYGNFFRGDWMELQWSKTERILKIMWRYFNMLQYLSYQILKWPTLSNSCNSQKGEYKKEIQRMQTGDSSKTSGELPLPSMAPRQTIRAWKRGVFPPVSIAEWGEISSEIYYTIHQQYTQWKQNTPRTILKFNLLMLKELSHLPGGKMLIISIPVICQKVMT